jgi:hypothetical protein
VVVVVVVVVVFLLLLFFRMEYSMNSEHSFFPTEYSISDEIIN